MVKGQGVEERGGLKGESAGRSHMAKHCPNLYLTAAKRQQNTEVSREL